MKFKRVAVISYHTCPLSDEDVTQTGGLNIYVLELSKALAKKGYVIDIYTRDVSEKGPKTVNVTDGLRVVHLQSGPREALPKKELIKYIPDFTKNFFEFIKTENLTYDLIYSHYYLAGLTGVEIRKKLKMPLLINFHTLGLMKNLVASGEEVEDIERIRTEELLLKEADYVIETSKTDAQYLSSLYNYPLKKIFVLTPGVDLERFTKIDKKRAKKQIGANLDHKIILFVGRIEPLKGIDVLLYALKILVGKKINLKICLFVVGSGEKELARLEEIKKVLGLNTYVRFVGKKKQSELPLYYNGAEVVVMPSQYESFGIVALEAMACGVPVITTDTSGISSLFDEHHHHLITSASNPMMLAGKIKHLLENKKDYERLSKEVREKAAKMSWEKVAEEFSVYFLV